MLVNSGKIIQEAGDYYGSDNYRITLIILKEEILMRMLQSVSESQFKGASYKDIPDEQFDEVIKL